MRPELRWRHTAALMALVSLWPLPCAVAATESPRERGAYLVDVLAACANCHTPRSPNGAGPALSGGTKFGGPESSLFAPNITPDRATGIGAWTDLQIIAAIRQSVRPDGSHIGPPMPQTAYRGMSDADTRAIVAYLRSVTAVVHMVPPSVRKMSPSNARVVSTPHPTSRPDNPIAQGRYIASALSHCTECHTPMPRPTPDAASHLDEGGRLFHTAKGTIVAPGIRAGDLKRFTDEQIKEIVTKGILPDGRKLEGPMPIKCYAGFRPQDLDTLLAFLRSDQT